MISTVRATWWWRGGTGGGRGRRQRDMPAWVSSLVLNVAVLLGMAFIAVPAPPRPAASLVIRQPPPEEAVEEEPRELAVSFEPEATVGAAGVGGLDVARALAAVMAEPETGAIEVPDWSPAAEPRVQEPSEVVPVGLEVSERLIVRGEAAVGTEGASGAVDRLTLEIVASLEERSTIVGWVFDQSVSLAGQRREIASRLERVFAELDLVRVTSHHDLLHLVHAYGERVMPVIDRPVPDGERVVRAIEAIPIDESGIENTFTAVQRMAIRAQEARGSARARNVMIVVFTDEVGNDEQHADEVAAVCRTLGIRVFVVGVPAPFGRREVEVKFVEFDDRFADEVRWPVADQGPESLVPEVVRIPVGGDLDEPIDSGFGPFSLSKLCAQTGGIYFAVHANRGSTGRVRDRDTAAMASRLRYFFAPDVMRHYRPDYVTAVEFERGLRANRAKVALVEAAREAELAPLDAPRMSFPREDDAALARLLSEAQKAAAVLQPKLDRLHARLAEGEADRASLTERRWQAGYDLALGRVLAHKVRTAGYNQMLAAAKGGRRFQDPGHDTWELVPSDDLGGLDSQTRRLAEQAGGLLRRVVETHPGTPWALIASKELERPLGFTWRETFTDVRARDRETTGTGAVPGDDRMRQIEKPKPQRPLKNI